MRFMRFVRFVRIALKLCPTFTVAALIAATYVCGRTRVCARCERYTRITIRFDQILFMSQK